MSTGITSSLSPAEKRRLDGISKDRNAAQGSVKANALAVKPAAVGQANATSPKARQSISLFQLVAGYNPARRVDVRSLPLVAA